MEHAGGQIGRCGSPNSKTLPFQGLDDHLVTNGSTSSLNGREQVQVWAVLRVDCLVKDTQMETLCQRLLSTAI
jgi:hypothetical protein